MNCKLCKYHKTYNEYNGKIREGYANGNLTLTREAVTLHKCKKCGVIWHDYIVPNAYYENGEYLQNSFTGNDNVQAHYKLNDERVLDMLNWTGTGVYRGKTIVDVGCGVGCLLDFIRGTASRAIGIEPANHFRKELINKGHMAYPSVSTLLNDYHGKVDLVTSFDVIEHTETPQEWLCGIYDALVPGGEIILGTPTDYPVLRKLYGKPFEEFIFSIHHPWVFSEKSLKWLFESAGFLKIKVEHKYHFGLGNVLNWLQHGTARGNVQYDFLPQSLNEAWRQSMMEQGMGEYLIIKAKR
jgi:2-polyprenyl-3-methyl-5-hydroxy-6-metoxy-1,4-benzoquinol methylase